LRLRLAKFAPIVLAAFIALAGCKQQQKSDSDAIRAGIEEHLASLKTLNLSAMDMRVTSVNIQGDHAQAQVEFRPKSGAPANAGMLVAYSLNKQNGNWVVEKTLSTGGIIDHPAAGANPHQQSGQPGTLGATDSQMIQDLVRRNSPESAGALPPGHPPVSSGATPGSEAPAKP
jgi:hypothetical protein